MKLKKPFKKKWLKALRSGEYRQTTNMLRRPGDDASFCCLGVACDLIDPNGWSDPSLTEVGLNWKTGLYRKTSNAHIHQDVADKIGLTEETQKKLSVMNDSGEKSFTQIATWISRNL